MPGSLPAAAVENELQDPAGYSWWLIALAVALVAFIALWYLWVWWWARRRERRAAEPLEQRIRPDRLAAIRREHIARVEEAYEDYAAQRSTLRELHLAFNAVVRDYATARTGRDVSSLTVMDLRGIERGSALADVLAGYSEPAFARTSTARAREAADQARAVIETW